MTSLSPSFQNENNRNCLQVVLRIRANVTCKAPHAKQVFKYISVPSPPPSSFFFLNGEQMVSLHILNSEESPNNQIWKECRGVERVTGFSFPRTLIFILGMGCHNDISSLKRTVSNSSHFRDSRKLMPRKVK